MFTKRMLLAALALPLAGCAPEFDAATDIHRTGQNDYRIAWDGLKENVALGDAMAGNYCKSIGQDFPNVTLNYGSGEVRFQCFKNGDHLVPAYPRAAISNTINVGQ